jgi:single-strand DNA-binding protein
MNNLNSIMIEGNMVREPSLKSTPNGTPVCTFSVAFNRYFKQESGKDPEVSFFDVETWSDLAKTCYNQGQKGQWVRIMGRLKQNRWDDSEGKHHSRVCIVAEKVEFRQRKKDDAMPRNDRPPLSHNMSQYQDDYVSAF